MTQQFSGTITKLYDNDSYKALQIGGQRFSLWPDVQGYHAVAQGQHVSGQFEWKPSRDGSKQYATIQSITGQAAPGPGPQQVAQAADPEIQRLQDEIEKRKKAAAAKAQAEQQAAADQPSAADIMRSVSNVLGHAIQAGRIEHASQLGAWAGAARAALRGVPWEDPNNPSPPPARVHDEQNPPPGEDYDDGIPF